jgi:hypothetical protein
MSRKLFAAFATALFATTITGRAAEDLPGPQIDWPEVKGLDRSKPNFFDDPKLGYSVGYSGSGTIISVYVYNLGRKKIEAGPESDAVKAEMYDSALAIEGNKASGQYKSIQPVDERVISFGSENGVPTIRRKRYEVDIAKRGEAITELYLTAYKDYFIKVRVTYPASDKAAHEKRVQSVLDALGPQFK